MLFLGRLLTLADRAHQAIGEFLRVGSGLVDLFRIFVEGFEPAVDVRRPSAPVVADTDLLAGHHRGHFRAEFFAGVLHAAEVPDPMFQGVAVHPIRVAGGVAEFV